MSAWDLTQELIYTDTPVQRPLLDEELRALADTEDMADDLGNMQAGFRAEVAGSGPTADLYLYVRDAAVEANVDALVAAHDPDTPLPDQPISPEDSLAQLAQDVVDAANSSERDAALLAWAESVTAPGEYGAPG